VILVYIFRELTKQTEEVPDPFHVFRAPGLLVSFEALRWETSGLTRPWNL